MCKVPKINYHPITATHWTIDNGSGHIPKERPGNTAPCNFELWLDDSHHGLGAKEVYVVVPLKKDDTKQRLLRSFWFDGKSSKYYLLIWIIPRL